MHDRALFIHETNKILNPEPASIAKEENNEDAYEDFYNEECGSEYHNEENNNNEEDGNEENNNEEYDNEEYDSEKYDNNE